MTQLSSTPRVKKDGIGEDMMRQLYTSFDTSNQDDFKLMCITAIGRSSGKLATKEKFINLINKTNSKRDMLTKVTNYFLAGEGKGV